MDRPFYAVLEDFLGAGTRKSLIEGILSSQFFGASALGPEFIRTKGFSVVFQRSGLEVVSEQLPFLEPILQKVLFADCNAFYINPLVLYDDSEVQPHIDCRLTPDNVRIIPNLVSVYYAEVSHAMEGGRLVLNTALESELQIRPNTDDLIHFLGSTIHRVESMQAGARRISIVCEQYNLEQATLQNFPVCQVIANSSPMARLNALQTELNPS
jgi:hypothetical protein